MPIPPTLHAYPLQKHSLAQLSVTPHGDLARTGPRTIRRDLNPALAGFLVEACAPASADRFATAADMQLALRNVRADL